MNGGLVAGIAQEELADDDNLPVELVENDEPLYDNLPPDFAMVGHTWSDP